jgi:hypothetical protein
VLHRTATRAEPEAKGNIARRAHLVFDNRIHRVSVLHAFVRLVCPDVEESTSRAFRVHNPEDDAKPSVCLVEISVECMYTATTIPPLGTTSFTWSFSTVNVM